MRARSLMVRLGAATPQGTSAFERHRRGVGDRRAPSLLVHARMALIQQQLLKIQQRQDCTLCLLWTATHHHALFEGSVLHNHKHIIFNIQTQF